MNYRKQLTKDQFNGLSWLAYYQVRFIEQLGPYTDVSCAANYCENVLGILPVYIMSVTIDGNIKGLQNMNRLTSVEYWD